MNPTKFLPDCDDSSETRNARDEMKEELADIVITFYPSYTEDGFKTAMIQKIDIEYPVVIYSDLGISVNDIYKKVIGFIEPRNGLVNFYHKFNPDEAKHAFPILAHELLNSPELPEGYEYVNEIIELLENEIQEQQEEYNKG